MKPKRERSVKKKSPGGSFLAKLCADGYCGEATVGKQVGCEAYEVLLPL